MKEKLKVKPSEELSYWTRVVQSDGSFCSYVEKKTGKIKCDISFGIYKAIKRPKYPQCSIRITSGEKQFELATSIRKILKCSTWFTFYEDEREITSVSYDCKWCDLEFLISPKTYKFFKNFVLPYNTIRV